MNLKKHKILITGGHLTPALAVIEELKSRGSNNIVWVGRKKTMRKDENNSAEYELMKKKNIPFYDLKTGKIVRFDSLKTFFLFLVNSLKILFGFVHSLFILLKIKPDIIISFGGYISVPIVITGKLLSIKAVTHEQTVVTGLANKLVARFADKIFISWEKSKDFFPKEKTVFTGNPVRKNIFIKKTNVFHLNKSLQTIYVTGGNQGSHIINKTLLSIIEDLLKKFNVIHQTGSYSKTKDFKKARKRSKKLKGTTNGVYLAKTHIYGKEIGEVFSKADILISRSGANIVSEILALDKKAILIPIPWSLKNEQMKNATMAANNKGVIILEEKVLNPKNLLRLIEKLSTMSNLSHGSESRPNAAKIIVDQINNIV